MTRMRHWLRLLVFCALLGPGLAHAVQPDEILSDPRLEARARTISSELRCLVCQNESIDDSGAQLARDLRLLVRERLKHGDTNAQVRAYLVARYGDFILLKPPVEPDTLLLWGMPVLVLGFGAVGLVLARRQRSSEPDQVPLSEAEQARLDALIGEQHGG